MIILASQSKHRAGLLEKLGVEFTTQPAHIDETPLKNETPLAYVKRIAMAKAEAISKANPGKVVLAADTPVIVGRRILQTPTTLEEATEMLRAQSGRRVSIPTVVVVADSTGKLHHKISTNWVKFKRLSDADITSYLKATPWNRVSGALHIEYAEPWILTMYGTISGIGGLPLYETSVLLARAGVEIKPFA